MDQTVEEKAAETSQCVSFRASPEDVSAIKNEAERRRTSVSSLIRGALLQAGILKENLI